MQLVEGLKSISIFFIQSHNSILLKIYNPPLEKVEPKGIKAGI